MNCRNSTTSIPSDRKQIFNLLYLPKEELQEFAIVPFNNRTVLEAHKVLAISILDSGAHEDRRVK